MGAPGTPALGNGPPRDASLGVSRVWGGRALSLGRPREGSPVVGDWPPPPSACALSPTQLAPSRVGGWNSVAVNLGRTRCTFVFITNPDAAAASEGCTCFGPHLGLSPAEPPAPSCPAQIGTNALSPIRLRPAAPLVNALVKKPTSHYIIKIGFFFGNW